MMNKGNQHCMPVILILPPGKSCPTHWASYCRDNMEEGEKDRGTIMPKLNSTIKHHSWFPVVAS